MSQSQASKQRSRNKDLRARGKRKAKQLGIRTGSLFVQQKNRREAEEIAQSAQAAYEARLANPQSFIEKNRQAFRKPGDQK